MCVYEFRDGEHLISIRMANVTHVEWYEGTTNITVHMVSGGTEQLIADDVAVAASVYEELRNALAE